MEKKKNMERSHPGVRHYFLLDVLLLIFWFLVTGIIFALIRGKFEDLTIYSLFVGLVAVLIVSYVSHKFILKGEKRRSSISHGFLSKIRRWSFLLAHLSVHLLLSNISLVRQTITKNIEPKIVDIPVKLNSESELTLLSSMITITPGTLVLKTEEIHEGYMLKVHFSYLKSDKVEKNIEGTVKRWERAIRGLFS